jgi:(1->4)-alpha-D-glucan 1-alpha-D-glucosylmutase
LGLRRDHPDLFAEGDFVAVPATGARRDHVFAFLRRHGDRTLLVAVPIRVSDGLRDDLPVIADDWWRDTALALPDSKSLPVATLLAGRPYAFRWC